MRTQSQERSSIRIVKNLIKLQQLLLLHAQYSKNDTSSDLLE